MGSWGAELRGPAGTGPPSHRGRTTLPTPQCAGPTAHTGAEGGHTVLLSPRAATCLRQVWPRAPNQPSGWFPLTSAPKAAGHSQAWSPRPAARGPRYGTTHHRLWALLPLQRGGLAPCQENGTPSLLAWRPHTPLGRGGNGVNDLHDAMQGGVCANGHVRATEVIVDGAHQPGDVQVRVGLGRALRDLAWAEASGG